jgi:hypothetical protein
MLARYFNRVFSSPTITPPDRAYPKHVLFGMESWTRKIREIFARFGGPTDAENESLKNCHLRAHEWLRLVLRRDRLRLLTAIAAAQASNPIAPGGAGGAPAAHSAVRDLRAFDHLTYGIIPETKMIEGYSGEASDNR